MSLHELLIFPRLAPYPNTHTLRTRRDGPAALAFRPTDLPHKAPEGTSLLPGHDRTTLSIRHTLSLGHLLAQHLHLDHTVDLPTLVSRIPVVVRVQVQVPRSLGHRDLHTGFQAALRHSEGHLDRPHHSEGQDQPVPPARHPNSVHHMRASRLRPHLVKTVRQARRPPHRPRCL